MCKNYNPHGQDTGSSYAAGEGIGIAPHDQLTRMELRVISLRGDGPTQRSEPCQACALGLCAQMRLEGMCACAGGKQVEDTTHYLAEKREVRLLKAIAEHHERNSPESELVSA